MSIHLPIKSLLVLALVLAVAAALVATQIGGGSQAAGASSRSANPVAARAVPSILRAATPSEDAAIRRSERQESDAFNFRLPAGARWSTAETNAYPKAAK